MSGIPLAALAIRPPEQVNPLEQIQRLGAIQGQQQEGQLRQEALKSAKFQNQQALKDQADQQKLEDAFVQSGGDIDKTFDIAAKAKVAPALLFKLKSASMAQKKEYLDLIKSGTDADKAKLDLIGKQSEMVGQAAGAILQLPLEQQGPATAQAIQQLTQQGVIPPEQAQQIAQSIPQDPAGLQKWLTLHQTAAQSTQQQIAAAQQQATFAETKRHNVAEESKKPVDQQELQDFLAKNPGKGPLDFAKLKATLSPQATFNINQQAGGGLTDVAKDQAAEKYFSTGQLPTNIGRGAAGAAVSKSIMNRAAELHPDANLAANSAEFAANKISLGKLQTNFDQVSAFEGTALKNLDLYVSRAKAIPDLGTKFANVPLRMITGKMIGEKNYAAMQAARQTAATETAKVLGSATASGVLSDSQKKDASDVLDGNLPLAATLEVVQTLKQDFANRHQSYADQIADIKGRLGGKNTSQPSTQSGGKPTGATHTGIGSADHKKHWLSADGKDLGVAE